MKPTRQRLRRNRLNKDNMKTIRIIITSLLLLALNSCQTPFEKEYALSIDSNEYLVSINGKTFPVYVYCSSSWTAALDSPVEWAEIIEGESGAGVGMVKLHVEPNYGDARSVNLVLRSGESEQVVLIRQNEFSVDYYATFDSKEQQIASGEYLAKVHMVTNIPQDVLAASRAFADVDWVSGITPYHILSDNQVIGTNRKIEVEFSFVVMKNTTDADRTATFALGVPAEYTEEMERVQTLVLVQTAEQAYIRAEASYDYTSDAQNGRIELSSNLLPVYHDMNLFTQSQFIDDWTLEVAGQHLYLNFSLEENRSGSARDGVFELSYRDLNGILTETQITIHQN